jgi:trigger factor
MSTDEVDKGAAVSVSDDAEEPKAEPQEQKLDIGVEITDVGPCKKHLKISIPRSEIERQYGQSLDKFQQEAAVPGFRPGRAPRQLIVKRFRKQVADQVKSALLMSSLKQLDDDYQLEPITQPRLDIEAIELPDDGPLDFEMEIEVRPQFDVPIYQGLKLVRPVAEISEKEVEYQLTRHLEQHGQVVPKLEGAAEIGDYLTVELTFIHPEGRVIDKAEEVEFRLRPELRFQNGSIPDLGATLVGASSGETRELEAKLGSAVGDPSLRGATIPVQVKVNDLKRMRLPEINEEFLRSIDFESLHELREAVREALKRRLQAEQRMLIRRQILDVLLKDKPFELPADLVSREEKSTVDRLVAQLRQEGFTSDDLRAREAEIRANAHEIASRTLKEVLLLGKIADAEGISVEEADLAQEIEAIAERTGESVRRVRARIEKEGGAESLLNPILERKVIDVVLKTAEISDVEVATTEPDTKVETLNFTLTALPQQSPPIETAAPEAEDLADRS